MIPFFAVLRFRTRRQRQFGVWLPLFLIWILLLPLALLLLPLFVIACLVARMNPWRLFTTGCQVIAGLAGTHIEVEHADTKVLIRII